MSQSDPLSSVIDSSPVRDDVILQGMNMGLIHFSLSQPSISNEPNDLSIELLEKYFQDTSNPSSPYLDPS